MNKRRCDAAETLVIEQLSRLTFEEQCEVLRRLWVRLRFSPGAGSVQDPVEAPTSPGTPSAVQAHQHLQHPNPPVPSQAIRELDARGLLLPTDQPCLNCGGLLSDHDSGRCRR